ncbi:ARM repeat-containing protein [Neolentinus lepideus HHB14362 ss-1]|uniref:ARM repeat-containing protein n=1 Tax=Neolentinus lepideus HHB14362 ss-1 TaxID=1314782 RepID=A0A165T6Z3_9AGAM|nr:ARM repeat-containing protein [Neolentinus lepideus HHB14362 ss-1]
MDGAPPQEEDFSTIPVQDRLAHKNWKARVSAYESLIKTFQTTASDTDPAFKPYVNNSDLLKKIVTDSNAVAQEKGVECAVALVRFSGETSARTREAIVPALVDKCFGSARAGTKNQAIELVLQYIEVENGGAGVVNDILAGLGAKQPKIVAGTVLALREAVRNFGIQAVPPPPILKSLPKIFGHTDKTVRAEGTTLAHTLYQYLGPAIEPWLADLKPVQVKELKEAFEVMEKEGKGRGSLKPERMTRQQAREMEAAGAAGDHEVTGDEEPTEDEPLDPRAFAEEVDIVPKLPSSLYTALGSSKWKERKEVLDDLLTLLNATPRIKDAPQLSEVAKAMATRIHSDANINCVIVAANCLEALAKGLMSSFARYREAVVGPMMERLKERKVNVTDAIGAALDAIFSTVTLPDILPDIQNALGNKNPQVKEGTLKFLSRCLSTSTAPVPPPQIKPLSEQLATVLEDSNAGARDEAANCLGTLMKMVGERPLNALMEGLADVRKVKVKEAYEKATVKAKVGAAPVPKATAPPPKAAPVSKANAEAPKKAAPPPATAPPAEALDDFPPKKPVGKPPARLMGKKPPAAATPAASAAPSAPAKKPIPAAASSKPAKGGAAPPPGTLDAFRYKHTPEEAEALIAEAIPGQIQTDFADANWKTRLAALEEMSVWLEGAVADMDAEVVVRFLAKKGWSEKNFQVSAKLYGILALIAEKCPSFGRSCIALSAPHLSEKLGDMKLKKPAGETLFIMAEQTSLQFVLNQAYEPLSKQKAPKVLADSLTWIDSALAEFGVAGLSLRNLIEFLKMALGNSNAAVRTNATKTLVTIKMFAGSGIKDLLGDLNPQLMNTIISEFDKVEGNAAPVPTRTQKDLASMSTSGEASGKSGAAAGPNPLDDLFPRVEIDGLLKGTTILADAKSDAWKTKKEALEILQATLDQGPNKRLKPTMGEIGQVLKARVTDTNKAVQTLALDIVARIATGMGKPFEKQTRFFALPVATVLSDQKASIRATALQTLTAIATACEGVDSMTNGLATALESSNPLQRASLLNWIAEWFKEHPPNSALDLTGWVQPVVACLDDRSGDVRKGAQAVLPILVACAGYDYVMQQSNSLKPASRASAVPLIQAARGSAPTAASVPAPAPAKAPAPAAAKAPAAVPPKVASPPPAPSPSPPPAAAPASKAAPPNKLTGIRRKLPQGTIPRPESHIESVDDVPATRMPTKLGGLRRPGTGSTGFARPTAPMSPVEATSEPFMTAREEPKKVRLAKDSQRWINEAGPTRKDLAELLQHQMEQHAAKDLVAQLFSHDHNAVNDHLAGMTRICDFYSSADMDDEKGKALRIANSDLPLKYASMKAHEPQSNLASKCLDVVDAVLAFMRTIDYQLTDPEALCFIPTMVYKLGDAREPVRQRVAQIIQTLPKVYAYSRVFQLLLEHGLKSKVAKTRQGSLDELASLLKRFGMSACEPNKALPQIAAMIADKDPQVRKSTLSALSEVYVLVGEKVWSLVGPLSPKDKTQLEERLRRVSGPSSPEKHEASPSQAVSRVAAGLSRPESRSGAIPRASSPSAAAKSRMVRPSSPARVPRTSSPAMSNESRPASPARASGVPAVSRIGGPASPLTAGRPKSLLPSRLGPPRARPAFAQQNVPSVPSPASAAPVEHPTTNGRNNGAIPPSRSSYEAVDDLTAVEMPPEDITITISSILSSDPYRSVDALKKIQEVLEVGPEAGPSSAAYQELAEHTEGLIETVTLQMAHVFDNPADLLLKENFRLAKHLIQTLNAFCDHVLLAESLTVDNLTSLLEELTLRLLETDDSPDGQVKELSRFINMIILRLFATARRMSVFRALFALLLQIVKPFPSNRTLSDSKEAKVAELVLKCIWKLARSIPQDLEKQVLDPVELFPAIEHFLQSVPPNEWRARATNKVPCGDMPLRTIKVIIQHVVAHYGDEVYDLLSASFDDPSATIVYPYVYRILNAGSRNGADVPVRLREQRMRQLSPTSSRPISPTASSAVSAGPRQSSPSHRTSRSASSINGHGGFSPPVEEPDPDAQLLTIISHISSETTGAMHKEGITELHHFLKAYPHKRARVDKMLESTGPAFRKYITRALASRAAEDDDRNAAVAHTLSWLESNRNDLASPTSPVSSKAEGSPRSPRMSTSEINGADERLSRLHNLFQYRSSVTSNGSAHGRSTPADTFPELSSRS